MNLWKKWHERIYMAIAGLIPALIAAALWMYKDVENLKSLFPLQVQVAVLTDRMNHVEDANKAQWQAIAGKRDK